MGQQHAHPQFTAGLSSQACMSIGVLLFGQFFVMYMVFVANATIRLHFVQGGFAARMASLATVYCRHQYIACFVGFFCFVATFAGLEFMGLVIKLRHGHPWVYRIYFRNRILRHA